MKEQKLYVCELCGTQYKDKDKALECEEVHKVIGKIKNVSYHANGDYPDRVEISFSDGKRIWYKR